MNVLPAPSPTSAPTGGRPGHEDAGEPGSFGRLLAGAVGDHEVSRRPGQAVVGASPHGEAHPGDTEGEHEVQGDVAAAVHAAIAAWRVDPGDVALGAHLRQVLREAVDATTEPAADVAGTGTPVAVEGTGPAAGVTPAAGEVPTRTIEPASETPPAVAGEPQSVASAPSEVPITPGTPGDATVVTAATDAPRTDTPPADAPTGAAPATGPSTVAPTTPDHAVAGHGPTAATDVSTTSEPTRDLPVGEVAELAPTGGADGAARSADAGPTAARSGGTAVTAASTLDRVLRAVEALEHAPPPRRMAIEVEGVQLSVALQGDEVSVAVRGGADHLAPGWQRDLAAALRGRGLGLAGDGGGGADSQHPSRRGTAGHPDRTPTRRPAPSPTSPSAEGTALRL